MRRDYEDSRRFAGNLPNGDSYIVTVGITGHQANHPGGYFSLTGDRYDERRTLASSGAIGDDVAATGRPELILADAMHLADAITGEPMHAIANAVYHQRRGDIGAAAWTLRVREEQIAHLSPVALRYFGEAQRPRWQREAQAMREMIAQPDDTYDPREPEDDPEEPAEVVDFPHADIIDSRELIAVLRSDDETFAPEVVAELDDAAGYCSDWEHGGQLIAVDHFEDYARQLADDLGAVEDDARWPACHIDWKAAADSLREDYTEISVDGVDYLTR